MARRSRQDVEVSLFPFLSVLVSIIGVLTLIIIGTTLGSSAERMVAFRDIDAGRVDQAELEARREQLRMGIEIHNQRLKALQQQLAQIVELRPAVAQLQDAVTQREKEGETDQVHLERLLAQVKAEKRKYDDLKARHGKTGSAVVIRIPKVLVGGAPFKPVFLDCRQEGVRILQSGKLIPTDEIAASTYVRRLLRNLKAAKKGWCAFLLIRPDGIKAYENVFKLIRDEGVRFGMYPVLTSKPFDVTDWQKPDWLR